MIVHVYVYENTETTLWFESMVICEGGPWILVREYDKDIPDPPGPGGTTDYNQLNNLPSINNVQVKGSKSSEQYNIINMTQAEKTKLSGLADIKQIGDGLALDPSTGTLSNTGGQGGTVDQTYNAESANAQSGKAVAQAVRSKAEQSSVIALQNSLEGVRSEAEGTKAELTQYKADIAIDLGGIVERLDTDEAAIEGKQDALESGTNIKTVNGQSLLGSGDLDVDDIFYITVDGDAFTPTSDPDVYEMELTSPYTLAELNAVLQSENSKSMILRLVSTSGTTKTINEVLLDVMAPTVFEGDLFYTDTYMEVSHSYAKFIIANVGGKTMLTRHTGRMGGEEHVELTQAEYDALTTEEKNNGKVYFITDAEVATVVDQTYDATSPHAQSGKAVAEALAQITIAVMSFYDGTSHLIIPAGAVKEVDVSAYNVPFITTTQDAVKYSTEFEYYCIGGLRQHIKLYGTRINANLPAFTTSGTDAKVNAFHVDTETQNGKIVKYIFDPRTVPNQIVVTRIIVSRILD